MWFALAALVITAKAVVAQQAAAPPVSSDRLFADSLFAELGRVRVAAALPAWRCGPQTASRRQLCETLIALRRTELTGSASDVRDANRLASRMILDQPRSALAWYALGISRLQLTAIHAIAKEGALQPSGVSNESAAANALVQSLDLDPTMNIAAEALALAALPPVPERAKRLEPRIRALRRSSTMLTPVALVGAGRLELISGSTDSAVADFERALSNGIPDSGLVALALARAEYRLGRSTAGRQTLIAGASDTTAASVKAYREQVGWVATPEELKLFDSIPASARPGWVADFWARRDVLEGHGDGARLVEHFARYEVAIHQYEMVIPSTGVHKLSQNADDFNNDLIDATRTASHAADDGAGDGDTQASLAQMLSLDFDARRYGASQPFKFVPQAQQVLDDRGIIYMRHGKPNQIATSSTGGTTMEIWRYNLPTGPLTLQFKNQDFSGTVGASVLVPTLLTGNAATRDAVCYLETSLCARTIDFARGRMGRRAGPSNLAEAKAGMLTTTRIQTAAAEGARQIEQAKTTDNFVHDFTAAMHPAVEIYGLARGTGTPRIVLPFALAGNELDADSTALTGRAFYTVHFQALAEDHADGRRVQLDTLRHFATPRLLHRGEYLSGVVEIAAAPALYGTSLTITQPSGRGAIAQMSDVQVPFATEGLSESDLVLGRTETGVKWNSTTTSVALNPLNTFPQGSAAEAYFQLAGLRVGASYTSRLEIYKASDTKDAAPQISVTVPLTPNEPAMEVSRTIGLQNLQPGRYRLKVTTTGNGANATTFAWLVVVK